MEDEEVVATMAMCLRKAPVSLLKDGLTPASTQQIVRIAKTDQLLSTSVSVCTNFLLPSCLLSSCLITYLRTLARRRACPPVLLNPATPALFSSACRSAAPDLLVVPTRSA